MANHVRELNRWSRFNQLLSDRLKLAGLIALFISLSPHGHAAEREQPVATPFKSAIEPILIEYCYDCHGDGMSKGKVSFDAFDSEAALVADHDLWASVLKNVRAGIMPPAKKSRPSPEEQAQLADWIKRDVFAVDPSNPDPGRITIRRLNRIEYRNTIRDLMGIDYNTLEEFPPDDTGYGFDNIGDVLTISPLLLEKYLKAAETIVTRARPKLDQVLPDFERLAQESRDQDPATRAASARELLEPFATRAFRRPVDPPMLDRLVGLARATFEQPGQDFEQGIANAMMAVLASPRFLYRLEEERPGQVGERYPQVDDYTLASRLSYFLWSTMPDAELFDLARQGTLRENLMTQVNRLLEDDKSTAFIRNFTGQWLLARDVLGVSINSRVVLRAEGASRKRIDLDHSLRRAMQQETEMTFAYVVRENRSVLELIDSDYTFLNERLANYYEIPGVTGSAMSRVTLPKDNPRGGILTQGTVLLVTSNPTRTSPVKRGLFILDNLLGTPPPPPPDNVPALEAAIASVDGRKPTVQEMLAIHRADALCRSCHARMDPLGLALENFNAIGLWRETEHGQTIEAAGELITGESFTNVRELKRILREDRYLDFYRCLTEKLLVYALGRGLDYHDVQTVDEIVDALNKDEGHFSTLLRGVVESAPFQQRRSSAELAAN